MIETMKIYGYSGVGTAMIGTGYVPLTIGTGLVMVGERLIDCGMWLQNKGSEMKLTSIGLEMLEKGELDRSFVQQEANVRGVGFSEALRMIVKQKLEKTVAEQSNVQQKEEPIVTAETAPEQTTPKVTVENPKVEKIEKIETEEDELGVAMAAAAALV